MIVRHGAERAPDPRAVEEQRQHCDEDCGNRCRHQVEFGNTDAGRLGDPFDRLVRDAKIQPANPGAPRDLRQAFDEERQPDRRHEQRNLRLIDEGTEHDAFGRERQDDHHRERRGHRKPGRKAHLQQSDVRQRGEEHHRALREIEHARRLVDQHEAERDERVHDAR